MIIILDYTNNNSTNNNINIKTIWLYLKFIIKHWNYILY